MRSDRSLPAVSRAAFALVVAAAALAAGCGTTTHVQPVVTKPLSRVTLSLHADTLTVGASHQFVATAYDTSGSVASGVTLTWQSTDPGVCLVAGSGLATAVGEGTTLVIASAGGKSDTARVYVKSAQAGWYEQASGTTRDLDAVCFLPDGHTGFAVGTLGAMVMTTNAGDLWTLRTSGASTELTSVWFSDALTGWAVGKAGVVIRSTDGGLSWAQRPALLSTALNLECVRFVDAQHGWIVGGTGNSFVARTRDGGATWSTKTFGSAALYAVSFADTSNGWAVGAGVIYGTHDGGTSWYLVQPSLTSQTLHGVARVGNAQAWAVGALGTVATSVATSDSLAWSLSSAGANYTLSAIHMVDATTGWIAGSNLATGAILATTDGGATWTPQASASTTALKGLYFADGFRGWAVGPGGRIVHTSTAGTP
jgi:photosystem II stability/assembly factor-like uncharacterized protein